MTGSAGSAEKVTLIVVEGAKTAGKQCRRLFSGISALASSTRRDASLCLPVMSSPAPSSHSAFLRPGIRIGVQEVRLDYIPA